MTGTVIVDPDGIYDPTLMNDRLLLGLRGNHEGEFELNLLRQRSAEGDSGKSQRGELQIQLAGGLCVDGEGRIEKRR